MAKQVVVVVKDRAADVYSTPMFFASVGLAVRTFTQEINNPDKKASLVAMHPEDFDLFQLGFFDDETGTFDTSSPQKLCLGRDVYVK